MRHYYEEWGRWMNRSPSKPEQPFGERVTVAAE
jgi:methanesulfonate monooxygenase large subunit